MDILYHINNQDDNNDQGTRLNLDELYEKKQQHDLFTLSSYNKILARIHSKIKLVSRQYNDQYHCWYVVPEVLLGIPKYNHKDCTAFVINKLQDNGFTIRYIHPNLLFISWKHWIPAYVRDEIKKKTGVAIDGYGNELNNGSTSNDNSLDLSKGSKPFSNLIKNREPENPDNIVLNMKNLNINGDKSSSKTEKQYRDINTYKPEGSLVYNNDMLKRLNLNI